MAKKKAPAVKSGGLRSLSDLDPVTRMEAILDGEDISPVTREEYFVKKAVTTASSELPAVTDADNGDVLTVVNGAWSKAEAPSGLPEVTAADNGDVLTVVSGEWAKAAPAGGLPAYTSADAGKVLTVSVPTSVLINESVRFEMLGAYIGYLNNSAPLDALEAGDTASVTIGSSSFTGTVAVTGGQYELSSGSIGIFWYRNSADSGTVYYTQEGTFTVKVETGSGDPVLIWATPT